MRTAPVQVRNGEESERSCEKASGGALRPNSHWLRSPDQVLHRDRTAADRQHIRQIRFGVAQGQLAADAALGTAKTMAELKNQMFSFRFSLCFPSGRKNCLFLT